MVVYFIIGMVIPTLRDVVKVNNLVIVRVILSDLIANGIDHVVDVVVILVIVRGTGIEDYVSEPVNVPIRHVIRAIRLIVTKEQLKEILVHVEVVEKGVGIDEVAVTISKP